MLEVSLVGDMKHHVGRDVAVRQAATDGRRMRQSPAATVAAGTRTRISVGCAVGFGSSLICTMSGGPYRTCTAAFTSSLHVLRAASTASEPATAGG